MSSSLSVPAASPTDTAWEAIAGAYDLHVHVAPDVIGRRIDDIDLAHEFLARGLKGFLLKSHYAPTAERAKVVTKAVPGIEVLGSITLNHAVGGLNPVAVEIAGRSGCRLVWMPTVDAENETAGLPTGGNKKLPFWAEIQRELAAMGISPPRMRLIDDAGELIPQARACMELIRNHDMILATGHVGRDEIFALVKGAREMGIRKILVTHAEFPSQNLTAEEQIALADIGAVIEHCFTTTHTGKAEWSAVFENVRRTGPERCLLSTDLGQKVNPPVSEGFALFAQNFLNAGFTVAEVRRMAVANSSDWVR